MNLSVVAVSNLPDIVPSISTSIAVSSIYVMKTAEVTVDKTAVLLSKSINVTWTATQNNGSAVAFMDEQYAGKILDINHFQINT